MGGHSIWLEGAELATWVLLQQQRGLGFTSRLEDRDCLGNPVHDCMETLDNVGKLR